MRTAMASRKILHVLVVDNDEPVCTALAEGLGSLGYNADCKTTSLTALKAFSEDPERFDLAIIEPVMPGITGLELAARFRRVRPDFPVIFYAGYADESLAHRIEAGGFGQVAFKPLTSKEMLEKIGNVLHLKTTTQLS
jgi:CheY-like chemotaxis protein